MLTSYKSCTLKIDLAANKQCQINLQVCDANQANTYLMKRTRMFTAGEKQTMYVQMPITGKSILISIFEHGTSADSSPVNFTIGSIKLTPLVRRLDVIEWTNKYVRNFIPFALRFCYNAGVMPTYNQRYYTNTPADPIRKLLFTGPVFNMKYVELIQEEGAAQLTPARIGIYDKVIEIARSKFLPVTIPGRAAILFHEFSHLFLNKKMVNETEADFNAAQIYFGLGFPVVELEEVFLDTFYQSPTDTNIERYEKLKKFIDSLVNLTQKL